MLAKLLNKSDYLFKQNFVDGKKTVKVFDFDVSSEEVSMHIPIVRFLAGMFISVYYF